MTRSVPRRRLGWPGPLTGDGIMDTFHDFYVTNSSGPGEIRDAGPTSGASGAFMWNDPAGWPGTLLGASVHGAGEDVARIRSHPGGAEIIVTRGDTGGQAWATILDGLGSFYTGGATAADLDGDGHAEVLATVLTEQGTILTQHGAVLDGGTGAPRWTVQP